jgi:hypothetical protein
MTFLAPLILKLTKNKKAPGLFPRAFQKKKPRVATRSTRGVNDQILASTCRMDASKAKKEASEIKISFCGVTRVHLCIPIDNQQLIYKFLTKCQ